MPVTVHIPNLWRDRTGGLDRVEVEGRSLREVFRNLDDLYPGMRQLIVDETDEIRGEIAVAINEVVPESSNLMDPVPENAELFLIPAIGGGA